MGNTLSAVVLQIRILWYEFPIRMHARFRDGQATSKSAVTAATTAAMAVVSATQKLSLLLYRGTCLFVCRVSQVAGGVDGATHACAFVFSPRAFS